MGMLDDVELATIKKVMEQTGGNVSAAAKVLGVSRTSLYPRLERLKRARVEQEKGDRAEGTLLYDTFDLVSPCGGSRRRVVECGPVVELVDADGNCETVPTWKLETWLQCRYMRLEVSPETKESIGMSEMRTIAVALALLILPVAASAQTHPCDQAPPPTTTVQSGTPQKVQFCSLQSDNIEAMVGYVDGVAQTLQPVTAKTAASSTGKILYETPLFLQVSRGNHVLTVATYNRDSFTGTLQIGALSAPFPFAVVDVTPVPTAPQIKGVTR